MLSLLIDMIKHSQSTQSNKFAVFLQYLKKEVRNGVSFLHADKHQSFYKLTLSFLMEVARHVQRNQNRKLGIFFQYIMKKVSQLLCVLWWCKTFRYFTRVQSCSLLLVFSFSLTAVCISRISCSDHPKLSFIFVRHVSNCVFHSSVSLLTPKSFCSYTFVFNFCISSNFVINSFFRFSTSRLFLLVNVSFILLFLSSSISAIVVSVFFWISQTGPYFLC